MRLTTADSAGLKRALEAVLLASRQPLSLGDLRRVFADQLAVDLLPALLDELRAEWDGDGRALELLQVASGWRFRTRAELMPFLDRLNPEKPPRYSRAVLETLAIIAYRQPVTRPQVDDIRGVDSAGALKNLLDRKLIRVLGKADDVGRPLIYGTTRAFLDFFSLSGLSDLPTLKDYQDLKGGAGVPEALPTPDDGPVKVMDLFDPLGSGDLVSKETEEESAKALTALENALGQATNVTARALAFEKGDVAAADAIPPPARYTIDDDEEDRVAHEASERHVAEGWPTDGSAETAPNDATALPPAKDASELPEAEAKEASDVADTERTASVVDEADTSAVAGGVSSASPDDGHGHFRTRRSDEGSRFTPRTLLREADAATGVPDDTAPTHDDGAGDAEPRDEEE